MRVTSEMQTQQTLRNLQMHYARMTKLQDQLASGKRIQRPSDAPADMVQIMQNRAEDLRLDAHLGTIRDAGVVLQTSVDAMTEAREVLTRARDVAIDVNSGSHDPVTDEAFAHEIDVALDRMLRVANRQLPDGRHLFGGTASGTVPFEVTSTDSASRPTAVAYRGSEQESEAVVGKALSVGTLISGSRVFQTRDRQTTVFTGSTKARPGSGTDNATVSGTLLVRHTLTTIAGASGVSTGLSSAADVNRILELASLVDGASSRPSVQAARNGAGRAAVVAALALEVDALQQSDRGRLVRYQQAAEAYLHEFRQSALDRLTLEQAHEAACRLAGALLPQRLVENDTP